jgi:hypothetical protein
MIFFDGQQTNSIPRKADKPHQSSVMIELFKLMLLLAHSIEANCCHFSGRKHSPVPIILLTEQSVVGKLISSRFELMYKQRNG